MHARAILENERALNLPRSVRVTLTEFIRVKREKESRTRTRDRDKPRLYAEPSVFVSIFPGSLLDSVARHSFVRTLSGSVSIFVFFFFCYPFFLSHSPAPKLFLSLAKARLPAVISSRFFIDSGYLTIGASGL